MILAATAIAVAILAFASAWHLYWGAGGTRGIDLSLPRKPDGSPVMALSRPGSFLVGLVLAAMALMPLVAAGLFPVPESAIRLALGIQGLVLVARALAWHRYVGLFKTVRDTAFGRWDTWAFSPMAGLAGASCLWIAHPW